MLLLFLICCIAFAVLAEPIIPRELAIVTVVDTRNEEIVRDAITLLRSMRLYGGTLNEATFVVCFAVQEGLQTVDPNVVSIFSGLGAQITYIHEVESPKAKTLNKFNAFYHFDRIKFSHFLWLDADIFVFADPIPLLTRHIVPGRIDCVPDFYSYMRRYPGINTTDLLWNHEMPDVIMVGDNLTTSHGHCNTGVLLFDSMSLSNFLHGLDNIVPAIIEQNNKVPLRDRRRNLMTDRFVDSKYSGVV